MAETNGHDFLDQSKNSEYNFLQLTLLLDMHLVVGVSTRLDL